ncbi:MAG: enoyl-[acyl-carrier-protein] reductase FabK [Chloroflexi bacterium]|nr:enoyl-[acyl-carrier-protein] reductase FabK [Chloroflexota bacterium]
MIRTSICDLFGIEYPIIQGGMAWVGTAELASAVSEAGGLGTIGCGGCPTSWVRDQIRRTREHTRKPFCVNILLMSPHVKDIVQVVIEERVPVVATGGGNPATLVAAFKEAGMKVMPVLSSVALARRLERSGVDAIVAEGMESGGHIGETTTAALVPQVVKAVNVPVIAAGGFASGSGLVSALAMGAQGIQMGTRFICSDECVAHPRFKEKIVQAGDRATTVTGGPTGHPVRCLENRLTRRFQELERAGASPEELQALGTGKMYQGVIEGDVEQGSLMAGQIAGLVKDVKPCRRIIEDIMAEAEAIIDRLAAMPRKEARV